MAYYGFLNIVFAPLLRFPPVLAIAVLSFIFSIINMAITKYFTDQSSLKRIKEQTEEYKKKIKELRKDPSKAAEMQKNVMDMNKLALEQMRHTFKPLMLTSIPIILLLIPWMNSVFAYENISPQEEFTLEALFAKGASGNASIKVNEGMDVLGEEIKQIENGKAVWKLKGREGEHLIEVYYSNDYNNEKQQKEILITEENKYVNPVKKTGGKISSITAGNKKLVVFPIGYKDWFGWLGTYFIFSIIFSIALKKIMKVY